MHTLELRCTCNIPYASVYNGVLSVVSRHGGELHTNACSIVLLLSVLHASKAHDPATLILPSGFKVSKQTAPAPLAQLLGLTEKDEPIPMIAPVCHRADCHRPWAFIAHGYLMINAWHKMEHHFNLINVERLQAMIPLDRWTPLGRLDSQKELD